jgi:hypothetical protein
MATEQPTKDEWAEIEGRLKDLYCPVYLDCDGYLVILRLERVGEMKLGITVHVDGWFRGKWMDPNNEAEEGRRFFQERSRYLHSAKERKRVEKKLGKKEAEKIGVYRRHTWRSPYWTSSRSLRKHLVKQNDRIRWVGQEEAVDRLEAHKGEASHET